MKRYKVIYMSTFDGDCCSVLVYADTAEEAKREVCSEYHDCGKIIDCYEYRR